MLEKLKRSIVLVLSVSLLVMSFVVIFWISKTEKDRLAEREKAALEAARIASQQEEAEERAAIGEVKSSEEAGKTLNDIEVLLSSLSGDDLPEGE